MVFEKSGQENSVNTKLPKSVTIYAQWNRKLSAAEKRLVGARGISPTLPINEVKEWIEFRKDATFKYYLSVDMYNSGYYNGKKRLNITGDYRVSGNKIHVSNQLSTVVEDLSPNSID